MEPSEETLTRLFDGFNHLGIFDDTPAAQRGTAIDAFCAVLEKKLVREGAVLKMA